MATHQPKPVTHPIFNEPVFNEGVVTRDPGEFAVFHANDEAIYQQVEELLKTKVVPFPKSRLPDDGLYPLAQALGANGAAVIETITRTGQIVPNPASGACEGPGGTHPPPRFAESLQGLDRAFTRPARQRQGVHTPRSPKTGRSHAPLARENRLDKF